MEEQRTKLLIITVTSILIFLGLVFAVGYAWFGADVTQSGNNSLVVDAARLGTITYYTGNTINVGGIYPGWCETKRINIKSTNATVSNSYVIKLNVVTNEFKAAGGNSGYIQMKATVVSGSSSGTSTLNAINIIATSGSAEILRGTLPANGTHTYDIQFCFPERKSNQNSQQGKKFNAYITVEMNYFEQDSWQTIAENLRNGKSSQYKVGDTKTVVLGSSLGTHKIRLANKTTTSNCSNTAYSQTACGFVLEFADIIVNHAMRTDSATNVGGWPALTSSVSGMRDYMNTTIYNSLPEDLRNLIIDTRVISGHGKTTGEGNFTTTDKLYLLSFVEIYGSNYTYDSVKNTETRQLDFYHDIGVTSSSYTGAFKVKGSSGANWWFRSAYSNNATQYRYVSNIGGSSQANATSTSVGVSPAFRIE